jgi:hypothetical protein
MGIAHRSHQAPHSGSSPRCVIAPVESTSTTGRGVQADETNHSPGARGRPRHGGYVPENTIQDDLSTLEHDERGVVGAFDEFVHLENRQHLTKQRRR